MLGRAGLRGQLLSLFLHLYLQRDILRRLLPVQILELSHLISQARPVLRSGRAVELSSRSRPPMA